ncbi:MAG: hypothetical protein AAF495_12035 [Pseudomonadota bacterium]
MSKAPAAERPNNRGIGTQDVLSAWMIYLVFLGALILLSTLYLQNDREEGLYTDGSSPDLALQLNQGHWSRPVIGNATGGV